jgi:hypothetical protein
MPESEIYRTRVVPAIERLKEKFPAGCPWTLEEVTANLHFDIWMLITFDDSFIILEEDGDYLHAVIAAAYDGTTDKFFEYTDMVSELAKNAGYKGFTFTTTRAGWIKLAKEAGFRIREVTFIHET